MHKEALGESKTQAPAPAMAPAPVMQLARAPYRKTDSDNRLIRLLQRKRAFGVTVAAAFLGGVVLRRVIR
jgi:hypothetical protein